MQQKIQQFVFLSEKVLSESGELRSRRTWNELCSVSIQLSQYMKQLTQSFDPKYALLFLLSCGNEGDPKNGLFSFLFRKILSKLPNNDLFNLLTSISVVELNTYLLPFLYEKEDIGSITAYIAAKIGLKIRFDSFEYFLTSREWSQEDLINLNLLVLPEEKESLIKSLTSFYSINKKEVVFKFINILKTSKITEPIVPDLKYSDQISNNNNINNQSNTKNNKILNIPVSNSSHLYKLTNNNKKNNNNVAAAVLPIPKTNNSSIQNNIVKAANTNNQLNSTELENQINLAPIKYNPEEDDTNKDNIEEKLNSSKRSPLTPKLPPKINSSRTSIKSNATTNSLSNKININSSLIPFIIVSIIIIVLIIFINVFTTSDTERKAIQPPPKVGKMPEYWIDAITNRKITPKYLEADVEYRMGELYLARNLYNEAIRYYSNALKIEPKHHIAKVKWGYVELSQGNYFAARKLLSDVYAEEPKLPNLNLYLARSYFGEKNYKKASTHYLNEYKNYGKLEVGIEYANFLAGIGKRDEAMDYLSILQNKYPGKMLILNPITSPVTNLNKKTLNK